MNNVVLIGFMGTGKTAVGRMLARRLRRPFVDLDERIVRQAGKPIPRLFAEEGEEAFRRREAKVIEQACALKGQVIAAGGGAALDPENRQRLKGSGLLVCLTARPEVIAKRTSGSPGSRPLLAGGDRTQRIEELLKERACAYAQADRTVDTSDRSVSGVVEEILRIIERAENGPAGSAGA